jgi:uncharacterized membrane protein YsdA (DUF1294 family)
MRGHSIALVLTIVMGSVGLGILLGHLLDLSPVASCLILLNLMTFVVYGIDKKQAQRGGSRVSELALLTLALFMASPGALLAMQCFRHKTQKGSFLFKVSCLMLLQLIIIGALSSAELGVMINLDPPAQNPR